MKIYRRSWSNFGTILEMNNLWELNQNESENVSICAIMFWNVSNALLYNMFLIQIVREGNKFIFFFFHVQSVSVFSLILSLRSFLTGTIENSN